jgi:predicted nucleic acid-binding Zn ribbon protein
VDSDAAETDREPPAELSAVDGAEVETAVDRPVDPVDEGTSLGRSALESARAASRRSPRRSGARRVAGRRGAEMRRGGYSGPGPDPRDPQPFGTLVRRLVEDRGWEATAANASILSNWAGVVGAELAGRCQPVSLRDGELTLAAESTAWATQLRGVLLPMLMTRIRSELGPDVVTRIRVHGPTAPTWGSGPRRIAGRGPRDTYG